MAKVLEVSRSGYHAWVDRPESRRKHVERELEREIRGVQKKAKRRYGSPRVTAALRKAGRRVGHNRVARIMRENDLQARPKRRFRVTTKAYPSAVAAENLLVFSDN
jgi:transposase InsO family protein